MNQDDNKASYFNFAFYIWVFFAVLLILSTFGFLGHFISSPRSESAYLLFCITAVLLSISLFPAMLVLILGCLEYHNGWMNGKVTFAEFSTAYSRMRFVRIAIFIELACSIILYTVPSFANYEIDCRSFFIFLILTIINEAALFQCIFQTSWIGTSRRTPSVAIALSNMLLYFTIILDLVCNDSINICLGPIEDGASLRIYLNNIFNSIPSSVKTGAVIVSAIAILKDFIGQMFAAISVLHPGNLSEQRRYIRHRILTHWNYKESVSTFSRENFRTEFLVTNVLFGIVCVFLMLCRYVWNEGATDIIHPPTIDSISCVAIFSLIFMIFAYTSLWSIRDETLIQSEYTYLSIKSIKLTPESIRNSNTLWMDFCQVLCNLTSNVSGIDSEDKSYHNIDKMLQKTLAQMTDPGSCARTKFICDILRTKGNIRGAMLRDSSHEKNENDVSIYTRHAPLQIARDLQFACVINNLLKVSLDSSSQSSDCSNILDLYEFSPLCYVNFLLARLFENQQINFGMIPDLYGISNQEIINLLTIDVILYLFRNEADSKTCGLSWLGCTCSKPVIGCSNNCPKPSDNFFEKCPGKYDKCPASIALRTMQREQLILILPFIVMKCCCDRWKNIDNKTLNILFFDAMVDYYYYFMTKKYKPYSTNNLNGLAIKTFRYLFDIGVPLSLIDYMHKTLYGRISPCSVSSMKDYLTKRIQEFSKVFSSSNTDPSSFSDDANILYKNLNSKFAALNAESLAKRGLSNADQWENTLYTPWQKIIGYTFIYIPEV